MSDVGCQKKGWFTADQVAGLKIAAGGFGKQAENVGLHKFSPTYALRAHGATTNGAASLKVLFCSGRGRWG